MLFLLLVIQAGLIVVKMESVLNVAQNSLIASLAFIFRMKITSRCFYESLTSQLTVFHGCPLAKKEIYMLSHHAVSDF